MKRPYTSLYVQSRLKSIRKDRTLYCMLALPVVFYTVFLYGPILGNVIAFRRFYAGGALLGESWVGFRYFRFFLTDPDFWGKFKNTFVLSFYNLLFGFPAPIILALLLNEINKKWFKRVVQTSTYLPYFLSVVVISGIFLELFSPSGVVNILLRRSGLAEDPIYFFHEPQYFRAIYVLSEIWQHAGFGAIIYLAALTGIDPQLYEAASIDGAGRWKQLWYVTLPGIAPTITIIFILSVGRMVYIGFEKVLLLYNPLIYSTADVISTYVYRTGLEQTQYSYATAIGLMESVIGVVMVLAANRIAKIYSETSLW